MLSAARRIRNKLLHCEFSTTRKQLNDVSPRARDSGATVFRNVEGMSLEDLVGRIERANVGEDVGQERVANTKTKKMCDVFVWLLECQGENEFCEAAEVFRKGSALIERLLNIEAAR